MSPPLTAVELFAGAGGLALGAERAGIRHVALVEFDQFYRVQWACATLRTNRPQWPVIESDVRDVDFTRYQGVDLVAGGPPCQPFSMAGERRLDRDERNMFPEAIRAVREVQPRAVLFENVTGLTKGAARDYLGWVIRQLRHLGYDVRWRVLNAANHGVPQLRQRVFVIGFRHDAGALWKWPKALWPRPTVRETIAGLEAEPPPEWALASDGEIGIRRVHSLDAPAWTITTNTNGTFLREDDGRMRFLAVRELARLQTFPDSWAFTGHDDKSRLRQIGNAVPPNLAHAVAGAVARALAPRL